jgi:hypothetical protein
MRIFHSITEIRQQVMVRSFPVKERLKVTIRSWDECEDVLDCLCRFFWDVSNEFYWHDMLRHLIAVFRFQVRLQKSSHVRMVLTCHGEFLLDVAILFDYRFNANVYDFREEKAEVDRYSAMIPKDFYKRKPRTIIPFIAFDNYRLGVGRNRVSHMEAVDGDLIEVNEFYKTEIDWRYL